VDRVSYCTHKVIFCMHNGFMPDMVDHINSNKLDNRIENLRLADKVTNGYNRGVQRNSKSGIKNVSWAKKANKWVVQITKDKKPAYCGYFEDLELAELVATEARSKFHGEYANHGGRLC